MTTTQDLADYIWEAFQDTNDVDGPNWLTLARIVEERLEPKAQWQPLSSAPNTGEMFLVASNEGNKPTLGVFQDGYFRYVLGRNKLAGYNKWFWMPIPDGPDQITPKERES